MNTVFDESKEVFNQYLENKILKEFPELRNLIVMLYGGKTLDEPLTSAEGHLKHENYLYKDTEYYYSFNNIDELEFIHFCSSEKKLLSIISSKSIWLNTVNNTNDTDEMLFASIPFGYSKEFYEKLRKEIFFFSFCTAKSSKENIDYDNANHLPMWTRYGSDGNGIAFKFKITNHPDSWYAFHMSKIKYGPKQLERINKLKDLIEDFNKKHPSFYIHLPKLFSFHKIGLWDYEDEVRLIYNGLVTKDNGVESYHTISNAITKEYYPQIKKVDSLTNKEDAFNLLLPLITKNYNSDILTDYLKTAPNIEISEVILGYKIGNDQLNNLRKVIQKEMSMHLGYILPDNKIYISKLKGKIR